MHFMQKPENKVKQEYEWAVPLQK
uniref:Uncharacterized protein n=1 Tax=Rhizophora mucronata TaxID=61149 RepID=A0A2P2QTI3_RHIMU